MGGNALKNTTTRRYSATEYHTLANVLPYRLLGELHSVLDVRVIPAYRTKESFGDMDILYQTRDDNPLDVDSVRFVFPDTREIIRNGEVISFEHNELQIDLIHSDYRAYEYARGYFSWNDCGNLVGKIARRFGLKHGHQGLTLPLRDGSNEFAEVVITQNHNKALKFLDLDPSGFQAGFDTLEDMFEWVSKSKWFNPSAYALENVSHYGRVRDRKRATYQAFLSWLESWEGNVVEMSSDKTVYLERIFTAFPDAYVQYDTATRELAVLQHLKTKFNGQIVSDLTGLVGKPLGEFMKSLRSQFFTRPGVLIHLTDAQIAERILESAKVLK